MPMLFFIPKLFIKRNLFAFLFFISFYSLNVYSEEVDNKAPENVPKNIAENVSENAAENKYYDVEIILFKQNNSSDLNSEYWTAINNENPSLETNTQAVIKQKLATFNVSEKTFIAYDQRVSLLADENLNLTKEAEHLKYSKKYKLLAHIAWRQAGLDKNKALPVEFNFNSRTIKGDITIVLSRFLHAQVDFNFITEICRTVKPVTIEDDDNNDKIKIEVQLNTQQKLATSATKLASDSDKKVCQLENIQFKQSRKMRSKELHYLDHPVFGLLIQINPARSK